MRIFGVLGRSCATLLPRARLNSEIWHLQRCCITPAGACGGLPEPPPGPFSGELDERGPSSLPLPAVCRSILRSTQIVIDLAWLCQLGPIGKANTAAAAAAAQRWAPGWTPRTRVMASLHDGWLDVPPAGQWAESDCPIVADESSVCVAPRARQPILLLEVLVSVSWCATVTSGSFPLLLVWIAHLAGFCISTAWRARPAVALHLNHGRQ